MILTEIDFFILNLLTFFMHQIFELTDTLYQQLRKEMGSKKNLWGCLRVFSMFSSLRAGNICLRGILSLPDSCEYQIALYCASGERCAHIPTLRLLYPP